MEKFMISYNEMFFSKIKDMLNEGGKYVWADKYEIPFIKKGDKLTTTTEGMVEVGKIVSQDFLLDNFKIDNHGN